MGGEGLGYIGSVDSRLKFDMSFTVLLTKLVESQ